MAWGLNTGSPGALSLRRAQQKLVAKGVPVEEPASARKCTTPTLFVNKQHEVQYQRLQLHPPVWRSRSSHCTQAGRQVGAGTTVSLLAAACGLTRAGGCEEAGLRERGCKNMRGPGNYIRANGRDSTPNGRACPNGGASVGQSRRPDAGTTRAQHGPAAWRILRNSARARADCVPGSRGARL